MNQTKKEKEKFGNYVKSKSLELRTYKCKNPQHQLMLKEGNLTLLITIQINWNKMIIISIT